MDGFQGNNGAGHDDQGQASQPNAIRRRLNRQAPVGGSEQGDTYMECRRNVSLSSGRYTVDGCTLFLDETANSMRCAACGCHRNFHRKVVPADHRVDPAQYLLFNDIPFVRPLPQPLQPPLPLMPQPEIPHEQVAESGSEEEEERSETDEERSEIDSESEAKVEDDEMINEGDDDSKED
ncbi:hypothetical protein DITRI_Ditri08aG0160800 [Diplodiscus trichospermus]